jgi:hypothetical protein
MRWMLATGLAAVAFGAAACLVDIDDVEGSGASAGAAGSAKGGTGGGAGAVWPDGGAGAGTGGTGGAAGVAGAAGSGGPPAYASYGFRRPIVVTAAAAPIPSDYALAISIDHANLIALGRARADGDDLRVARWDGNSWQELDRTRRWFRVTARPRCTRSDRRTAANQNYLHYGDAAAGAPRTSVGSSCSGSSRPLNKWDRSCLFFGGLRPGGAERIDQGRATTDQSQADRVAWFDDVALGRDGSCRTWPIWRRACGRQSAGWQAHELSMEATAGAEISPGVRALYSRPSPTSGLDARPTRIVGHRESDDQRSQVAPPAGGPACRRLRQRLGGFAASSAAWWIDDVCRLVDQPSVALGGEP